MPAIQVFAASIKYLKDQILTRLNESAHGQNKDVGEIDEYILWVLTVPAIWSDSAKQFMSEAAVQVK